MARRIRSIRENLVIADDVRAVGIGGVMGGEETGVTDDRNVLLESAYFLPASIRRTARNLNLPSDASYRFERGVDPGMILRASERATQLIREIAGGEPAGETIIGRNIAGASTRIRSALCALRPTGRASIARRQIKFWKASACKSGRKGRETEWQIPTYRSDLRREADLIEEIVRAYGIDRIPVAIAAGSRRFERGSRATTLDPIAPATRSPRIL